MKEYSNAQRAQVLTEALPYITHYYGSTIVVKYGGNAMVSETLRQQVMEDIVLLTMVGIRVVLVHGGGPEISRLMNALGKKPEFINGLRVTDKETVDIVQMVLAGKVNKSLVNLLNVKGGNAVGLAGMDGHLIETQMRDPRFGYVGDVKKVNTGIIMDLLSDGYIPVISTVGADDEGNVYNINGDTAAGRIAGALHAKRLIMMTDTPGVLKDKDDPSSLMQELTIGEAKVLEKEGIITEGMIPKIECCITALNEGVEGVVIMDGRIPHAVLMEILTDEGAGTMLKKEQEHV